MTDKKITQLDELLGAGVADDDLLVIRDMSATSTKKIKKSELAAALNVSPVLTGNPTAPTQSAGNNSTRLATTAFVKESRDAQDALLAPRTQTNGIGPGHKAGWYLIAGTPGNADSIPAEAVLHAVPLPPLTVARAFDRISVLSTLAGSAGAVVRLGIYSSDAGGQPDALVFDAGTVDGTQTGVLTITISQTLQPGNYWLAAAVQGGAGTRTKLANSGAAQSESRLVLGGNNTWNQYGQNGYTRNSVSGALPSTFGTPTSTTGQATLVALRCA